MFILPSPSSYRDRRMSSYRDRRIRQTGFNSFETWDRTSVRQPDSGYIYRYNIRLVRQSMYRIDPSGLCWQIVLYRLHPGSLPIPLPAAGRWLRGAVERTYGPAFYGDRLDGCDYNTYGRRCTLSHLRWLLALSQLTVTSTVHRCTKKKTYECDNKYFERSCFHMLCATGYDRSGSLERKVHER